MRINALVTELESSRHLYFQSSGIDAVHCRSATLKARGESNSLSSRVVHLSESNILCQ